MMWIGPSYLSLINGLNKQQQKALEDFASENPAPTKSLKKVAKAAESVANPTGGAPVEEEEEDEPDLAGMDAYDLASAVDIFKTYNEAFFESVLSLPKWNEKKAKMEEFIQKAAKTPKFTNTHIGWISTILKKLFMDSNVVVHKTALQVLACCARGLRKNFSQVAKKEAAGLLLKFRETKLIEDIFQALEAFDYCIKPIDILDDIKAALKEKHTGVKCNTIDWLCKTLGKLDPSDTEAVADKLLPIMVDMTEEGDKSVREAGSKFVGFVNFQCGEDQFSKYTSKIQSNKLKTIQKYQAEFEKGGVSNGKADPKAKAAPAKPKGAVADSAPPKPQKPSLQKDSSKTKEIKEEVEEIIKSSVKGGKNLTLAQNEAPRLKEPNMTIEEVEDKLRDIEFDQAVIDGLGSNTWEKKKEALEKTLDWLADNSGFSEEVMILIRETTKQFTFSNPSFNKELFSGLMRVSEDLECKKKLLNEENVRIMLEFCVERFNEKNFLNKIQDLLIRCCSMVDPKALVSTLIDLVKKKTFNPKISETLNDLLSKLITILTAAHLPVAELIEFSKFTFDQKNGSIRKIGITVICQLYSNLGPKIKDYLQDVNQSIMKTIDAEMKKVTVNTKARPHVEIFGAKSGAIVEAGQAAPVADVSTALNALVPGLEHSNWQTRKEALDQALTVLASASYNVKPQGLDSFLAAVIKRVEDSHKTPLKVGIELAGVIAKSLGKHFKPWVKVLLPALTKNLQDKQAAVRETAREALSLVYESVETEQDAVVKEMLGALAQESVELKQEALLFLNSHTDNLDHIDYKNSVEVILKGLESKAKVLREGFEQFLKNSVDAKGEEVFLRIAKNLVPASSKVAQAALDRIAGRDGFPEIATSTRMVRDTSVSKLERDTRAAGRDMSRSRNASATKATRKQATQDPYGEEIEGKSSAIALPTTHNQDEANPIVASVLFGENGLDKNKVKLIYRDNLHQWWKKIKSCPLNMEL